MLLLCSQKCFRADGTEYFKLIDLDKLKSFWDGARFVLEGVTLRLDGRDGDSDTSKSRPWSAGGAVKSEARAVWTDVSDQKRDGPAADSDTSKTKRSKTKSRTWCAGGAVKSEARAVWTDFSDKKEEKAARRSGKSLWKAGKDRVRPTAVLGSWKKKDADSPSEHQPDGPKWVSDGGSTTGSFSRTRHSYDGRPEQGFQQADSSRPRRVQARPSRVSVFVNGRKQPRLGADYASPYAQADTWVRHGGLSHEISERDKKKTRSWDTPAATVSHYCCAYT